MRTTLPAHLSRGQPKSDSLAVWSLVLGIGGLVLCPMIPSIIAIILGGKSKRKIAGSGGTLTGEGLAKAGAILGWIGVALGALVGITVMLAGITAVILYPQAKGAKIDIAKTGLVKISKQIELFNINIGHYPSEEDGGLNALITRPGFTDEKLAEKWRGPYLTTEDLKDPWNNAWHYELTPATGGTTDQNPFKLWSNGPDGMDGTEDDIKNWSDTTTG